MPIADAHALREKVVKHISIFFFFFSSFPSSLFSVWARLLPCCGLLMLLVSFDFHYTSHATAIEQFFSLHIYFYFYFTVTYLSLYLANQSRAHTHSLTSTNEPTVPTEHTLRLTLTLFSYFSVVVAVFFFFFNNPLWGFCIWWCSLTAQHRVCS